MQGVCYTSFWTPDDRPWAVKLRVANKFLRLIHYTSLEISGILRTSLVGKIYAFWKRKQRHSKWPCLSFFFLSVPAFSPTPHAPPVSRTTRSRSWRKVTERQFPVKETRSPVTTPARWMTGRSLTPISVSGNPTGKTSESSRKWCLIAVKKNPGKVRAWTIRHQFAQPIRITL